MKLSTNFKASVTNAVALPGRRGIAWGPPPATNWGSSTRRTLRHAGRLQPGSFQGFSDSFNNKAREAQKQLEEWAREQRLQEKLDSAGKAAASKAQQAFEQVQDSVQRTASQIDREYEVREKVEDAKRRVQRTADEVDSKYGVRRKLKDAYDDVRRKWPTWRRQLSEFFNTPLGTVTAVLLLSVAIYSGLIFHLLRWFTFVLLIGPLVMAPYIRKKAEEQEQARQAAYAEYQRQAAEQQRRQQQQQQQRFVNMNDLFGRFQQRSARRQQQQQPPPPPQGGRGQRGWDSGPVIDVEHQTLDE